MPCTSRSHQRTSAQEHASITVMLRVQGGHHETECRLADLSVQLERALSSNAMLEGRNQLLEQFVGLQVRLQPVCRVTVSLWPLTACRIRGVASLSAGDGRQASHITAATICIVPGQQLDCSKFQ